MGKHIPLQRLPTAQGPLAEWDSLGGGGCETEATMATSLGLHYPSGALVLFNSQKVPQKFTEAKKHRRNH